MEDKALQIIKKGKLIACDKITGVNDNMQDTHYHDFYEFYFLEKGQRYIFINDKIHLITPDQLVFFEPYVLHRSYGDDDIEFTRILIYFDKKIIRNHKLLDSLKGLSGVYEFDVKTTALIRDSFYALKDNQSQDNLFNEDYSTSLLEILIISFIRNKDSLRPNLLGNKMSSILQYIINNYHENISLAYLADKFYISQYHLCREFKRHANITLIQYINKTRISNAQKLLYDKTRSIISIAHDVGFANVTHFNRVFKQLTNQTPSQFRKSLFM